MTQAIVARIPVFNPFLSKSQKDLANKKLSGAVLTPFEQLRHYSLVCLSSYRTFYEEKESRIIPITDEFTKIYDTTIQGLASVEQLKGKDRLFWAGSVIYIPLEGSFPAPSFSRASGIDYGVVSDGKRSGEIVIDQVNLPQFQNPLDPDLRFSVDTLNLGSIDLPAVKQVFGWANWTLEPERTELYHFGYPQAEPEDKPIPMELVSNLPVSEIEIPRLKTLVNQVLSQQPLAAASSSSHTRLLEQNPFYQTVYQAKQARIHSFREEGVRLFDYTEQALASITLDGFTLEYITLRGFKVDYPRLFSDSPNRYFTPFSSKEPIFTSHFTIHDIDGKNWVKIERHMTRTISSLLPFIDALYVNLDELVPFATGLYYVPKNSLPAVTTEKPRRHRSTKEPSAKRQAISVHNKPISLPNA